MIKHQEYRGKIKSNNKWIYGSLLKMKQTTFIIDESGNQIAVKEKSIGQYFGKKDVNGKKIFTGDIIRRLSYDTFYQVVFDEKHAKFQMERLIDSYPFDFMEMDAFKDDIEVLGNMYENDYKKYLNL